MSTRLLVTLTVLEILALVLALAVYLIMVAKRLRSIAATLAKVTFGVRAVEQQVSVIGPGVNQMNGTLEELSRVLPGLADRAERLASRRR